MAKKGLGKGLSALILEKENQSENQNNILTLAISKIRPNPNQPRKIFEKKPLNELASSIKEHGILQPLVAFKKGSAYYLISGERRLRAAQLAGLSKVPVLLKNVSDESSSELAIIENIQRENLSPLEESEAYEQLISQFSLTQDMVAKKVGKSRSYITNLLRLKQLPKQVINYIEKGELSASHGRSILAIDECYQETLADYIVENRLNVREVEALVKDFSIEKISKKTPTTKTLGNNEKDVHREAVEKDLESIFGTKVFIKGKNKGSIVLKYHNEEDLIRIVEKLLK
ncbi:hypothetical protein AZF37_09615 [endosymbiont 'TC1' of Trimyema compressum]|uniref:ParB/RepB/Spo0J family partition protein n=1 Tax=endosymbiont 'TC1' of Trimyema compressum TaxID=243899 RepID=UPI0007F0CFFD|nr:ParB/RepB/Spo0J family partition protein [endosymbiont 'TC1' of Trimyema compressum]AMP21374.1 hypothetical protein AZF37_09615 [endosymbiont 'TC1' of Trimyema compressum]